MVKKDNLTALALRQAVVDTLADPTAAATAARIGDEMRESPGVDGAVAELVKLAGPG